MADESVRNDKLRSDGNVEISNVASEGGWGYLVCVGVTIVFVICFSHFQSMGIIYKGFLDSIGEGPQGFTIVTGVMTAVMSTAGILTNVSMKRFSLRQVGWVAAVLLSLGWLLNVWVTSIFHLSITIGVLQGLGSGVLMTTALTSFNQYFKRKRVSLMALCNLATGLANMSAPLVLATCLETVGFRSTMLLMAAISAHGIFAITLMHPVEWHQNKTRRVRLHEAEKFIEENAREKCVEGVAKVFPVEINQYSELTLVTQEAEGKNTRAILMKNRNNVLSKSTQSSKWKRIAETFDFHIFKDPILWNICIGISISDITDVVFFMLLPLDMMNNGFTMNETAWCMSIVAGADLVSRGFVGILGHFSDITSRSIFYTGISLTFIFRIIFCLVDGYLLICILAGILGFLRALMVVPTSLVIAEYIPDKFPAALGMNTLIMGFLGTLMFPLAGFISEIFGSFVVPYSILNIMLLTMCIVPWGIEFIVLKRRRKINKYNVSCRNEKCSEED